MRGQVKIGGRPKKNDPRRLHNYVGVLDLKAETHTDAFLLAAINRALFDNGKSARGLRTALIKEAERCKAQHEKQVKAIETALGS